MPTKVSYSPIFQKNIKRLSRNYPKVVDSLGILIDQLENDERPGDKIPRVGYDVYKVRIKNPSAQRGKSGGFRAIYYVELADSVILLTIYSKTQQNDISPDEIRQIVLSIQSSHNELGDI
jgi:mRNA-degrading endonuclease RelE of RelBE toxin-antitoxin system